MPNLEKVDVHAGDGEIHAIVETPRGSRNKYKYEPKLGLFTLHKVLPPGAVFPYDFGFIPSTLCEDGDPLDVLLLMEEAVPPGCVVRVRVVGVLEAEQTEDGNTVRNDRLLAVASACHGYCEVNTMKDLPPELVDGIEHFFVSYNEMQGRVYKPVGRHGPRTAAKLIERAARRARRAQPRKRKKAAKV